MSFQQVYKVARREYIARVRNKAFIIMTIMVPAFMGIYIAVLPLLFEGAGKEELKISILDGETGLGGSLAERLESVSSPRLEVAENLIVTDLTDEARQPFNARVLQEQLDGYIVLAPDPEILATARFYARESNPNLIRRLELAVHTTLLTEILDGSGVDVDRVKKVQRSDVEIVTVSSEGEEEGGFEVAFFSTIALTMLLYMAVLINGQGMAMAIVEEKSSRLIEVILGAVTAAEFMAGKILGVLGSGLTQLGIWIGGALIMVLFALPAMAMGTAETGFDLSSFLSFNLLFYFAIFFALGYLLYSTLFAIVAATCTSTEELSQSLFPAMLPIIIALFASMFAAISPSALATRVLSLIPLFTPLVMLARVNVLMPPLWEIWLGIILLALGSLGAAWLAAKVFRFALLMQGKRPSFKDIARMIRAA